jgi:integration host factor subunit beta
MTRSELVVRLFNSHRQLQIADVDLAVKLIITSISYRLATGGRVEIRSFGTFCLKYRPSRSGRNPKSGEQVDVPSKYVPHFRAGQKLKRGVNEDTP